MFKNLVLAFAFIVTPIGLNGLSTSVVVAQCGCGDCESSGCDTVGQTDGYFENASNPNNVFDGCQRGCPDPGCCPAACCGDYVSVFGGLSTFDAFQADFVPAVNISEERSLDADEGFGWGFALGKQFHPRARAELEFSYRENDFDSFANIESTTDADGVTLVTNRDIEAATGDYESYAIMANMVYDFSPRCLDRFNLYGGAGIGAIGVNGTATTATRVLDVSDASFAYQIIFGVNKSVTQTVDLFADYRYMSASSLSVTNETTGDNLGGLTLDTNNLMFGLRYRY